MENRAPQPNDLIAYVHGEDGVPIAGVEAKVGIQRTVGFFTGAGTPPIASRSLSNADGELRFSSETNWQDWIRDKIGAYAWTDSTGFALVWLPKGSNDVRWDTALAATGVVYRIERRVVIRP